MRVQLPPRAPEKASKKDLWPKKPESMWLVRASTQGSRSPHFFDYQPSCFTLAGVERASGQKDRIKHKKRQSIRKQCGALFETAEMPLEKWRPFYIKPGNP